MKKLLLFAFSFCLLPIAYCQLPNYWQQQVNYKIDVTLNDVDNSLDGFVKMDYYNNSPDTLFFIWFHVWPNAFKNDKTAFTDQDLENGSTDFYFSNADKRGYINRLDFKVDGEVAKTTDHPQHQDIIKLLLSKPIAPKSSAKIETTFHVKLPYNFSRGGHIDQAFHITQWYPKPAVYDRKGWHPMPYLDQGEFYADFGNYEVQITLPENYLVAATGDLQNATEKDWIKNTKPFTPQPKQKKPNQQITFGQKKKLEENPVPSSVKTKTLQYKQNNVHDFAWFADKTYTYKTDTLQLPSGKIINAHVFYYNKNKDTWTNSIAMIKRAIITKSKWLGEYPFNVVTVVDGGNGGGMEYPTITLLDDGGSEKSLDFVINHEVGHNWFEAILGTNERTHPWMDEGMNTYYDSRYALQQYGNTNIDIIQTKSAFIKNRMPNDILRTLLQTVTSIKKDQPIETSSENFSALNYNIIAYTKAGDWMKNLEAILGKETFDKAMQTYYDRWHFKHPYPEDFKKVMEEVSGKNLDLVFAALGTKGDIAYQEITKIPSVHNPTARQLSKETRKDFKKDIRFASFFNLKETDKHHYIFAAPAIGYNYYDKFMVGLLLHNYTLPQNKFQFIVAPLYATKSKQFNGIGRISYSFYPGSKGQKFVVALAGSRFSTRRSLDTTRKDVFENYYKVAPSLRYYFAHTPRSNKISFIDLRSFIIGEKNFTNYKYITGSDSVAVYPTAFIQSNRYLNQLTYSLTNYRALYPYSLQLQLQQGEGFYRLNATGNYFFNYAKGGGLNARIFAAKFGFLGNKKASAFAYTPKLLAGTGEDDYTYSNYFVGRTAAASNPELPVANNGLGGRQVLIQNGGGFKLRLDQYTFLYGQSENWIAATNLNTTIPKAIFPFKLPILLYLDIGTYAEAWKKNATTSKFLYTAGLQLSLFKNVLNIYAPLIYSNEFKSTIKTDAKLKKFSERITFSIDFQNISPKKLIPQIPF